MRQSGYANGMDSRPAKNAALPGLAAPKQALEQIPGTLPDMLDPPAGCLFQARCREADERCVQVPPLAEIEPKRRAACWRRIEESEAV